MATKFEKLIEYVINDEEQKARDLFHEIVVEKSRGIYENLMANEAKEEEMEESKEEEEESIEEGLMGEDDAMEGMGGDQADELLKDVAYEEEGMSEEEEMPMGDEEPLDDMGGEMPMGDEMGHDMGDEAEEHEEIENTVMNIDSKLDELLAKFEEVIGHEGGEEEEAGEEEEESNPFGGEEEEEEEVAESLAENVQLQKVAVDAKNPKLAGTSAGGDKLNINNKSVDASNAGKGVTGAVAQPVKTKGADVNPDGKQYKAPGAIGNLPDAGKFKNVPAKTGNAKLGSTPQAGKGDKFVGTGSNSGSAKENNKSPLKGIKG